VGGSDLYCTSPIKRSSEVWSMCAVLSTSVFFFWCAATLEKEKRTLRRCGSDTGARQRVMRRPRNSASESLSTFFLCLHCPLRERAFFF
jgi:hypothetical protein